MAVAELKSFYGAAFKKNIKILLSSWVLNIFFMKMKNTIYVYSV